MPMNKADAIRQGLVQLDDLDCPKFERWEGKHDPDDKDSPKYTHLTPFQWVYGGHVLVRFGNGLNDYVMITDDQFWKWATKPAPLPEKETAGAKAA